MGGTWIKPVKYLMLLQEVQDILLEGMLILQIILVFNHILIYLHQLLRQENFTMGYQEWFMCLNILWPLFSFQGDSIVSCDADGITKIWNVRMVKGRSQFNAGLYSANAVAWDQSGTLLLIGSDDQKIRIFLQNETIFKEHENAVQDVAFDTNGKRIISCGSDAIFRIYQ